MKAVPQRKQWDCGIAALAAVLDVPYGDVAAKFRAMSRYPRRGDGLRIEYIEMLGAALGVRMKRIYRKRGYLDGATGVLGFAGGKLPKCGHWVVLKAGTTVIDPHSRDISTLVDYMISHRAWPCTIVVRA